MYAYHILETILVPNNGMFRNNPCQITLHFLNDRVFCAKFCVLTRAWVQYVQVNSLDRSWQKPAGQKARLVSSRSKGGMNTENQTKYKYLACSFLLQSINWWMCLNASIVIKMLWAWNCTQVSIMWSTHYKDPARSNDTLSQSSVSQAMDGSTDCIPSLANILRTTQTSIRPVLKR